MNHNRWIFKSRLKAWECLFQKILSILLTFLGLFLRQNDTRRVIQHLSSRKCSLCSRTHRRWIGRLLAEIEVFRFLLWLRNFCVCTILLILYLIPVLQTSDWRMFFTIAFIESFKVPNLSLFAARQTILPSLSLILIERPVLAFFSVEQLKTN